MREPMTLAVLMGSTREGRLCEAVTRWVIDEVARTERYRVDVIDPLTLELPVRQGADDSQSQQALQRRIAAADAVVVVTPEYNHSFPAPLKQVIDSVYSDWWARPVAFVSYGGFSGGIRAVEQLRLVFAELQTVTISQAVHLANAWELFDETGSPTLSFRQRRSLSKLLAQLSWWAAVLRDARASRAQPEAA